jgi:curli biogenesis system outer membrane secretion channel CsgG
MKPKLFLIIAVFASGLLPGQNPPAPKAAVTKPSSSVATPVDDVIKLVKSGMSEAFIIKSLQKSNKPISLTPADLVKLKNAGVSENIMSVMMDPSSAPSSDAPVVKHPVSVAIGQSPSPSPAPVSVVPVANTPTPASTISSVPDDKKRVIVDAFDYAAVQTSVQAIFGTQQNIGRGIRAMLTDRLTKQKDVIVVERDKIDLLEKEQERNKSNRVKQGTGAGIGREHGADALLAGDIIIFGRDDKKKGIKGGVATPWCSFCGGVGIGKKQDKAVVAINYRFIDAATSEVIASGEARGESIRKSFDWAGLAGSWGKGVGAGEVDMTSSNFAETIIGEATQDCVNKLAAILMTQAAVMKKKPREVDALVADISGNTLMISAGASDGVAAGDVFEVMRSEREIRDPNTKELLDHVLTKVGEVRVDTVRDRVSSGTYFGSPASVGYIVHKKI